MIHCEDVSVKFARRVEAILADPEILEAPSALHLAAFYGGYAFAVPGVGWIPGAVDAHIGVSGTSMRSWHHVYMRLRGRDGLVQVAKAILAVVSHGPRDPEASQGTPVSQSPPEHVVRTLGQAWRLQRVGIYLGELTLDWLYNFMLGARAADEDYFPGRAAHRNPQYTRFERWLQGRYECPDAAWHRILRVYGGPGLDGLELFFELWDEFLVEEGELLRPSVPDSVGDLQLVDGLTWLRSQASRFFRCGTPNAHETIGHILHDVLSCAPACTITHLDSWWLVSCAVDWMQHGQLSVEELFGRVVAAPELGPNSMRSEAIVMAFASEIAVADASGWHAVKGDVDEALRASSPWESGAARTVAFKLGAAGATHSGQTLTAPTEALP